MGTPESACMYLSQLGGCKNSQLPHGYAVETQAIKDVTHVCILMNEQQNQRFCPGFSPKTEPIVTEHTPEAKIG